MSVSWDGRRARSLPHQAVEVAEVLRNTLWLLTRGTGKTHDESVEARSSLASRLGDRQHKFMQTVLTLPIHGLRSLCWDRGTLIDWISGGRRIHLDGRIEGMVCEGGFADRFDAAVVSPSGDHVAVYQKHGAEALLLRHGRALRPLSRDDHCMERTHYPICFIALPDGSEALVHCPDAHNRLVIEHVQSGQRISEPGADEPQDYFIEALRVSPDSRFVLSQGWHWHPIDRMTVYDVQAGLRDREHFDQLGFAWPTFAGIGFACFGGNDVLAMTLVEPMVGDEDDDDDDDDDGSDDEREIDVRFYDLRDGSLISDVEPDMQAQCLAVVDEERFIGCSDQGLGIFDRVSGRLLSEGPQLPEQALILDDPATGMLAVYGAGILTVYRA